MVQVGDVIVSFDVLKEKFCCDLDACQGKCCVEGDDGAPVTLDEVAEIEALLPEIIDDLTPEAREVIARQGVAYTDRSGDLVTSIVKGRNCAFCRTLPGGWVGCAIECAFREGRVGFMKPVSCHLYPIRVGDCGVYKALNYHRWDVCKAAVLKGEQLGMSVYKFLREPLIRRFGEEWYAELELVASELEKQQII
jgi:hypothetical protein